MLRQHHKNYLWGVLVGILLVFAPWWIIVLAVAAIITVLIMGNDDDRPHQAQITQKGASKKSTKIQHAGGYSYSHFQERECTWDFL